MEKVVGVCVCVPSPSSWCRLRHALQKHCGLHKLWCHICYNVQLVYTQLMCVYYTACKQAFGDIEACYCTSPCDLPWNHVCHFDCMASCVDNIQAVMYTAVYTDPGLHFKNMKTFSLWDYELCRSRGKPLRLSAQLCICACAWLFSVYKVSSQSCSVSIAHLQLMQLYRQRLSRT